jgi:hypothetical protein
MVFGGVKRERRTTETKTTERETVRGDYRRSPVTEDVSRSKG